MNTDIARELAKAGALPGPDLTLNGRAGTPVSLVEQSLEFFNMLAAATFELNSPGSFSAGDAATLADGAIITSDQGCGQWAITAHEAGGAQWLAVSTLDGVQEAQIDADLADAVTVAHSAITLWGWATVGPAVY